MTDTLTNYLGIPVEGEITRSGRSETPQRTAEEFAPILLAVLNAEGVEAVRWRQYTPYFNDGEACYFSAYMDENVVKIAGLEATEEDSDDDDLSWLSLGTVQLDGGAEYVYERVPTTERGYSSYNYEKKFTGRTFPRHPAADAVRALGKAINSGEFDDVLLDAFGDHANVEVTRDGITVEFYEHD